MDYQSVRSAHVSQTLARLAILHGPVAAFVESQIALLEQNPTRVSRPAFSLLPTGQVFQFDHEFQGMTYQFDLVFRYGSDEQTLYLEYLYLETV